MKELAVIRKQIAELQEKERLIISESKSKAIDQINAIMNEFGLTLADLSSKKKKAASTTSIVLYRDGANTWSGATRGRKPKWITDHINNDVDIEKFRL